MHFVVSIVTEDESYGSSGEEHKRDEPSEPGGEESPPEQVLEGKYVVDSSRVLLLEKKNCGEIFVNMK